MKKTSKPLVYFMILSLALSVAIVGCQRDEARLTPRDNNYVNNQRDVALDNPFYNDGSRMPNDYTNNFTPREGGVVYDNKEVRNANNNNNDNRIASKTKEIYDRLAALSGINDSTVIINGTTAVVGVDINKNAQGNLTNNLKKKVENTVKASDKNIKNVVVTADPDLFERLQKIGQDIRNGRPLTGLGNEMQEIIRRVSPK